MFPRRLLMVLLGFGVVFGYGSAIAQARWRHAHGGGCHSSWRGEGPYGWNGEERLNEERSQPAPVAAPAPAPQTVVVQPAAAPAPAQPAPQIFVIMPGAQPAALPVQVVPVQVQAPVAPAPAVAAKPAAP